MPDGLETHSLSNVPIFAAGKWNGDTYTEEDIDQMILAFEETKGFMKPYLKLGHDPKQKLVQSDGLPAAGWIEKLSRVGKTLYADFSHVPKKIYELVQTKAWRKVSAEIFVNRDFEGKRYPFMLKAASFLGADWPGVHSLEDIIALYGLGGEVKMHEEEIEAKRYEFTLTEDDMSEELQKQLAEVNKELGEKDAKIKELGAEAEKVVSLTKENEGLKTSLADATRKIGELETFKAEAETKAREANVTAILDKAVQDKKLTPAQKPYMFTLLMNASQEKTFKVGEKEQTAEELIKAFLDSNTVSIKTEEESKAGMKQGTSGDALHEKALKYREAHKEVSYRDALIAISPRNDVKSEAEDEQ